MWYLASMAMRSPSNRIIMTESPGSSSILLYYVPNCTVWTSWSGAFDFIWQKIHLSLSNFVRFHFGACVSSLGSDGDFVFFRPFSFSSTFESLYYVQQFICHFTSFIIIVWAVICLGNARFVKVAPASHSFRRLSCKFTYLAKLCSGVDPICCFGQFNG